MDIVLWPPTNIWMRFKELRTLLSIIFIQIHTAMHWWIWIYVLVSTVLQLEIIYAKYSMLNAIIVIDVFDCTSSAYSIWNISIDMLYVQCTHCHCIQLSQRTSSFSRCHLKLYSQMHHECNVKWWWLNITLELCHCSQSSTCVLMYTYVYAHYTSIVHVLVEIVNSLCVYGGECVADLWKSIFNLA